MEQLNECRNYRTSQVNCRQSSFATVACCSRFYSKLCAVLASSVLCTSMVVADGWRLIDDKRHRECIGILLHSRCCHILIRECRRLRIQGNSFLIASEAERRRAIVLSETRINLSVPLIFAGLSRRPTPPPPLPPWAFSGHHSIHYLTAVNKQCARASVCCGQAMYSSVQFCSVCVWVWRHAGVPQHNSMLVVLRLFALDLGLLIKYTSECVTFV